MGVEPLIGRSAETGVLSALLDGVDDNGASLVVRGEAGIGKTSLLEHAAEQAGARGMAVLRTSGVQAETHLPFAGLHQLLRPILARSDELPVRQREALLTAFGLDETAAAEFYRVALAALDLLAGQAATSPLLLIADDAQWLDRPTCDALAFLARRISTEPIIFLAGVRDGYETPLLNAGLPELSLTGLDHSAAARSA